MYIIKVSFIIQNVTLKKLTHVHGMWTTLAACLQSTGMWRGRGSMGGPTPYGLGVVLQDVRNGDVAGPRQAFAQGAPGGSTGWPF